jgi:serine O-acetyltransferase
MILKNCAFGRDLEKFYRIDLEESRPGPGAKLNIWVNNFGLHCVAAYRFGQFASHLCHKNILIGFIPKTIHRCLNFLVRMIYHVEINALSIGPGFYIGHIGTILIGPSNIGKNLSVTHNVTIGVGYSPGREGRPVIGDNVWIGTGSTLTGAITIGNNVTIIPGTFLSRSIPDGCLVGGNPARVLAQNYDNQKLL